jgi:hypothetical protein
VFFETEQEVHRILELGEAAFDPTRLSGSLAYAALRGNRGIVKVLLEATTDVNDMFSVGVESISYYSSHIQRNCLGFAISGKDWSTIELILNRHPDLVHRPVEKRAFERISALQLAGKFGLPSPQLDQIKARCNVPDVEKG